MTVRTKRIIKRKPRVAHKKVMLASPNKYPFSGRITTTVKFSSAYNLTSGSIGQPGDFVFRMNSIYDPEYAVGGPSPFGKGVLEQLYNKYRVFKMKYDIEYIQSNNTGFICVVPANTNVLFSGSAHAIVTLPQSNVHAIGTNSGRMRGMIDLAKFNGVRKSEYDSNPNYESIMTDNPSETLGLHCVVFNPSGTTGNSVFCVINLTYYVECFDVKIDRL